MELNLTHLGNSAALRSQGEGDSIEAVGRVEQGLSF